MLGDKTISLSKTKGVHYFYFYAIVIFLQQQTYISIYLCFVKTVVAVAQLVESRIVIPVVAGSSPVGHPKILKPV